MPRIALCERYESSAWRIQGDEKRKQVNKTWNEKNEQEGQKLNITGANIIT